MLGEGQLHRTRVAGVAGPLDQPGRLQGARQLRDIQRFQAGVVGEPTLTGPLALALHAVQRRGQYVLRMGQTQRSNRAIDRDTPLAGEPPYQEAGRGTRWNRAHTE